MPITLEDAKVGMADKVDQQVIDTFRRSSYLLDNLIFDNAISPGTGGSTLTYGYIQLKTPSTAAVREINTEYTAGEAIREEKTAKAAIMGGSFQVDRVIQETSGAIDEMAFQVEEKIKATANLFHYNVINGEAATSFDGLSTLLDGASTEVEADVDLSTSALMDENANAFLDAVDSWLSTMEDLPTMLLMNGAMLTKFRGIARRAGYYTQSRDDFGRVVEAYNAIPLIDLGKYYDGSESVDVVPIEEQKTDIYAVQIGLNAFHGISPQGTGVITSRLPDFSEPGVVKEGDVELVAGVVLKNTLRAGVLRGVTVNPT